MNKKQIEYEIYQKTCANFKDTLIRFHALKNVNIKLQKIWYIVYKKSKVFFAFKTFY